jgi:hypothetical protein
MIGRAWFVIHTVLRIVLGVALFCTAPLVVGLWLLEWFVFGTNLWIEEWSNAYCRALLGNSYD